MKTARDENIAAISAVFHTDKRYEEFYNKYGPALDGFPGIWNMVSDAAIGFSEAEMALQLNPETTFEWGNQVEWIDMIDSFVDRLYRWEGWPVAPSYAELAREVIVEGLKS